VSNLNIIPKSYVEWFVQTFTGMKKKVKYDENGKKVEEGGLMNDIGYIIIIMIGAILFVALIFTLHYLSSKFPK
jgi:hypothetical protein